MENVIDIKVIAKDLASAVLKGINTNTANFTKSISSMFTRIKDVALNAAKQGIMVLGTAITGMLGLGLKAAVSFESMGVALNTAFEGNAKAAKDAQKQITEFAKKTPYQLDEVLGSFIKLKNRGLDPSERALEAYGNTASSMGKSLDQMIEAVADASTGEFERLKEFGIKASKEGDKVTFTFKGVKKVVKNDAAEIEKYLIGLGETQFAGGMEAQSKTMSGMFSTLKDNISLTLASIVQDIGLFDLLKGGLERVNKFFDENSEKIKQTVLNLKDIIVTSFSTIKGAVEFITTGNFTGDFLRGIGLEEDDAIIDKLVTIRDTIIDVFGTIKGIIKNALSIARKEFEKIKPILQVIGSIVGENLKESFNNLKESINPIIESLKELWIAAKPVLEVILKIAGVLAAVFIVILSELIVILSTIAGPILIFVIDQFTTFFNKIVEGFNFIKAIIEGVIAFFTWLGESIVSLGTITIKAWGDMVTYAGDLANELVYLFQVVIWGGIKSALTNVKNFAVGIFDSIITKIKEFFSAAGNIKDSITSAIKDFINSNVIDKFNGIEINVLGKKIGLPDIPRLAKGGDFETNGPQLIMVGDNPGGKERVQVTPTSSRNVNGPKGSGKNIIINNTFNNTNVNPDVVASKLAFQLKFI